MTRAERVVDASVLGAFFFKEDRFSEARSLIESADLVAPAHVLAELTSIGAKKVWLGHADADTAASALKTTVEVLKDVVDLEGLVPAALRMAVEHRFSAYDALYLALAAVREIRVITFDGRLIRAARTAGLSHLVA